MLLNIKVYNFLKIYFDLCVCVVYVCGHMVSEAGRGCRIHWNWGLSTWRMRTQLPSSAIATNTLTH